MYLKNNCGKWATVKRVSHVLSEMTVDNCKTSKCAIGLIVIDKVFDNIIDITSEIRSMLLFKNEDIIQQYYGLTLFELSDDKPWKSQLESILDRDFDLNVIHPRMVTSGKSYLFFANKYTETKVKQ